MKPEPQPQRSEHEHKFESDGGTCQVCGLSMAQIIMEQPATDELEKQICDVESVMDEAKLLRRQLAAEREKFRKAKEWNQITELQLGNSQSLVEELLKDADAKFIEVHQQLLAAQAVIAEHNKKFDGWTVGELTKSLFQPIEVNLSALDKHDEKVRKPMVDALNFFKSVIQSGESWTQTCQKAYDAALAKVKEPIK